ncbi:MAG TPA: hypothetical protein VF376_14280, partial [Thermoanaerobaculia bacterium]
MRSGVRPIGCAGLFLAAALDTAAGDAPAEGTASGTFASAEKNVTVAGATHSGRSRSRSTK